jgi:AcrR family transcriptional regulator
MEPMNWKRQHADRTREELLETARGQFIEKGYAATSLEEVVSQAGMSRGALYHHVKDKRTLFGAVVERTIEEIGDRVAAVSKARFARQAKHK